MDSDASPPKWWKWENAARPKRSDPLELWTIYDHPTDFPNHFVARRWVVNKAYGHATQDHILADTLAELRAALRIHRPWLYRLPRQPDDDKKIVEVWL